MQPLWIVAIVSLLAGACVCQKTPHHRCCNIGEEFVKNSTQYGSYIVTADPRQCSRSYFREYISRTEPNIRNTKLCSWLARSCCIRSLKSEVCRLAAMIEDDCESLVVDGSSMIGEIRLDCCLCCQTNISISMGTLDNCNLLNGKCPQKISRMASVAMDNSSLEMYTTMVAENVNSTQVGSSNYTDMSRAPTYDPRTSYIPRDNDSYIQTNSTSTITTRTLSSDVISSDHGTTARPLRSTAGTKQQSSTSSSSGKPILCDRGYEWDSSLQVCSQMMISCPKAFVLHPDIKRCVPIIQPKIPCPPGFLFNQFKTQCTDIDECKNATICLNKTQVCVNLVGSYRCECLKGFRFNKHDVCEDIDECMTPDICPEDKKCKNRLGSYKCVRAIPCGFGWREDAETNECVDINECETYPDICGYGMKCVNIRGSHRCEDEECPNNMKRNNRGKCSQCRDGFAMSNSTHQCEDIDECVERDHLYKGRCKDSEHCINIPGSYECRPKKKCRPGTLLTMNGTECEDIDECKEMVFRCDSDDICVNTYSSYQCVASPCAPSQYYDYRTEGCLCKDGYRLNSENNCEDIDECSDSGASVQCGSSYRCVNKPGGYICINKINCTKGMYRPSANSICQDIDECETGEGKCPTNMHCINIVGSYKCMCDRGFIMLKNNTCADINECLLFRPEESCPDLEARCVNTPGSYKCQCAKGFQWSDYPVKKCLDIDECREKSNPCGVLHTCVNIIGSYKCQCHPGYRLTIAGDKCEDIDECSFLPRKCVNGRCVNIPGRYSCQCPKGFLLDKNEVCQDIDECLTFQGMCPMSIHPESAKRCINLLGYYKCVNNSCPEEYSQTPLGNGHICMLNQENHCELRNTRCLLSRPYRQSLQFFELSPNVELPRTLTRINVGHLPPGNQRNILQVKYAHHTDTKEPILIQNSFQLSKNRNRNEEIEVVLRHTIAAPAEVLLYLQTNIYHRDLYYGNSEAFIYLYFTKYPEDFA